MARFKSAWSFIEFSQLVRARYRYARTPEVSEFLAALLETCAARRKSLPKGSVLWRAQMGTATVQRTLEDSDMTVYFDQDIPLPADRMKPLRNAAHEGRVNPKGIPCLYAATDKETAMSEVRPWLGAKISVSAVTTERILHVVDCSVHHSSRLNPDWFVGSPSQEAIADGVWAQVDRAFSEPVNDDLATAEYVPTQIISETFRQSGVDGVVYKSRLGPGFSVALFDLDSASISRRMLFKVERVTYEFAPEILPPGTA